jgi:putative CocE/NonD family hydrolase
VQDQRFVERRPDVLSWETDPLKEDVVATGDIAIDLFASTTGSDSDWVAKLIDVFPEDYQKVSADEAEKGNGPVLNGYELIVADDIVRGRYRSSLENPQAITPNHVTAFKVDLHPNDHAFLKGHRIMVQVQSTWFPLYDRNPQRFVKNIYTASDADYVKATQTIYRSKDAPSGVLLPVVSH